MRFVFALFTGVSANVPGACLAPPSGLVSWWSGDDTAYDLVGFNDGVLKAGAGYANGHVGRGFTFDGVDDYIQTTTWGMNLGTLDFTIVGWEKTTSTKAFSTLVEFEFHNPSLGIAGDGTLRLYPPGVGPAVGGFNDGQFHHFAIARKDGVVSFYKDGVLVGTNAYTGNINQNKFYIGYNTLPSDAFAGIIDEVAFFERALTGGEVAAIFSAGSAGMCKPGLSSLSYFIEAEDFDFNGGQHQAEADSMPYLGGAYAGLSATAEIDYHDPGANENVDYRPASQGVAILGNNDTYRNGYSLASNYKIGYCDAGDWFNYTRMFPVPPRDYRIVARLSSGALPNAILLDEVIGGLGTSSQTTLRIGQAIGPASGGWDTFNFVPVTDNSGNPVVVNYGGQKTIRVTILAGGNEDINYLQFVPQDTTSNSICAASPSGLTAWWPGDGHPFDLQGAHHGALKNGASYATGKVGEGFAFDGFDDYVDTALDVQPSAMPSTTWECWVFPTRVAAGRYQILSCDDGGYDRSLLIEGGSFGVFVGFGVWMPVGFTPNQWQHIAVVYTPNNVEFYRNGVRFSFNAAPTGGATGNKLQIGRNPGFGEYFQGIIDEVGIYNRALSAAEIQSIYSGDEAGRCKSTMPCPTITISPASLSSSTAGTMVNQTLTASGGTAPYTFALASGSLPPSLTLSSNGLLSGVLTSTGDFSFVLRVTDNNGCSRPQNYSLAVTSRPPPCPNLPAGLVSWWGAEGNAEDAVGLNSAALLNGTAFAPGKVGQAFSFDGNTNYIRLATNGLNVGAGDFTVEGWIKTTATKNYNCIFSYDNYNPAIYVRFNGGLQLFPHAISTNVFNDGQFYHFAVVRVSGQITYFKDGVAGETVAGGSLLNAQNIYIGTSTYGGENFPGLIDELSFYNRALTPTEIVAIFNKGSGGKCGTGGTACPSLGGINPTGGAIGSSVTISGANFTGDTTVRFANNVPANITAVTATTITATVPGGAVTGPITISKSNCADIQTITFTVSPVGPGGGATNGALYVLNDCNGCANQIYGYGADETSGALTLLPGFPLSPGGNGDSGFSSERLAVDRVNRRLYAINGGSGTVSAFAIHPTTGALTPLPFSPLNLGSGVWRTIDVHPGGSPLVAGDFGSGGAGGRLASFQITATTASAAAGSPYIAGSQPVSTVFSQDGSYLYTGGGGIFNSSIAGFSVNAASGVLTALSGSPFNAGSDNPGAYATDAAGRLFVGINEQLRAFTTASGIPTGVSGNPFTSGLGFTEHGLTHESGFYLVADLAGNRVGVYRINGSGSATVLAAVSGSPFAAGGTSTRVLALNQAGTFLFAANDGTRNLTTFSVNPVTGALAALGTQPANTLGTAGRLTGLAYLALTTNAGVPDIALSATSLNFGNVTIGNSTNLTLIVTNVGGSTLTVTSLTTNNPVFRIVFPAAPFNLGPGAQAVVTLRFSPALAGLQNGSLSITSSDSDEPTLVVALAGSGVDPVSPPDIALSGTNLNFGTVALGSSNDLTLTVSNVGTSTLTITSLTTNNPAFRVLSPVTPLNVNAGTQAVVTLRFSPINSGAHTGAVSIASNDPDEATVNVGFSGAGATNATSPPVITSITPMNAVPGSLVTLSGTNFGETASGVLVRFGNNVVAIQSITSTQIVVRLPLALNGPVSVSVTVNDATSDEFSFQVQTPASSLRITEVSLTPTNSVRMLTQPVWPNPNELLLESSDSPTGPWWKETEVTRNSAPLGHEFFTPRKPYYAQRFFRVGAFANATLPFIRFVAPNSNVRPGLSVTLLGANFSPTPALNIVRFELPIQSWTATVTEAGTNYLIVTVPAGLITSSTGVLYRVTVSTAQGTGNGAGCSVSSTAGNAFSLRPDEVFILQPPGTGMETLVVGGGVPPYQILPLTSNESAVAVVSLNGPVITVVARTNVTSGGLYLRVQDSSTNPPQQAASDIYIRRPDFAPPFTASFHTLLAGTAPGVTMTARFQFMQPEQMELRLQNVQIELGQLRPGSLLGLVRLYYSSSAYGFQHLLVNEVTAGRATFEIVSLEGSGVETIARGELIQNPPTIVINAIGQEAATVMPTTVDQEIIFDDNIFRLPATAGQNFSIIADFTSVSTRDDQYAPVRSTVTTNFTTTGVTAGAPRIERLLPVHGEVRRNIELRGTGFDANLASNVVTFAGIGGTRVPAKVLRQTNDAIYLTVPKNAVSGPVQLTVNGQTGNDFSFFVRFHPDAVVIFSGLTNNTPAAPRFIHQQPEDEDETIGEVPLQSVTATLDQGRLALTGVASNQQVGTVFLVNFYSGRRSTNIIVYKGQETEAPQRHRFEILPSPGSTLLLARIYATDDMDGEGVVFQIEGGTGIFQFNAGIMWDYQFTTPIYRPPAVSGVDVNVRIEAVSRQWMSLPNSEMRFILNSLERVQ